MKKDEVFSPLATPPKGPYCQAIKLTNVNSIIFTGTITALDENWQMVGAGDIEVQVRKTIENLENILIAAGASLENVVKTTWYL